MELISSIDSISRMIYINGDLFIPLTCGQVQAIDVNKMEAIWQTAAISGVQSITTLSYSNGYLYGTYSDVLDSGVLYKIDIEDTMPNVSNEEKDFEWKIENDSAYYWAGQFVYKNIIIIGDDSGTIRTFDTDGNELDKYTLESKEKIRSTMVEYEGNVYFTDSAGNFYKTSISNDGKIDIIQFVSIGSKSVSTPAIYNDRAYVGAYNAESRKGEICVIDINNMELIYSAEVDGEVMSAPLISTVYGTSENDFEVYVYFTANNKTSEVYMLRDSKNTKSAESETIFTPEESEQNYCISSIISDENGKLYYTNDSGNLFCVD